MTSQGNNQISVSIPGEKNTQQILATLGNTAQLLFRPALCYAPPFRCRRDTALDRPVPHLLRRRRSSPRPTSECRPSSSSINGYTSNLGNIQADPQFATYRPPRRSGQQERHGAAARRHRRSIERRRPLRARSGPASPAPTSSRRAPAWSTASGWSTSPSPAPVGRSGTPSPKAAVPRDHRHGPRRPGDLSPHHPADQAASPRSTERSRSAATSPRTGEDPGHRVSPTAPCR